MSDGLPRFRGLLLALTLPLFAAACGGDGPVGPEDTEFAPELGVDLDEMTRLGTGVYVQTIQSGLGSYLLQPSDSVEVSYVLWLPDGTEVDQGTLVDALSSLIPGVRDALLGTDGLVGPAVIGDRRLIVIPAERGYGANPPAGSGIPAGSILVFRMEILDIPTRP